MKIKVFYDNQIFSMQKTGGISRYFVELKKEFSEDVITSNQFYLTSNVYYEKKYDLMFKFKGHQRFQSAINNAIDKIELLKNKFDIFHPTYYFPRQIYEEFRGKKIITIHDMIHEIYPEQFPDSGLVTANKIKLIKSANKVIAISNQTKKDIIRLFNTPEDKIEVIYHGTSFKNHKDSSGDISYSLPTRYILFVGTRSGYKGFVSTLNVIAKILARENVTLLCAGGGRFTADELELINRLGLNGLVSQCSLSDRELVFAYKNAMFLIFPSRYEGFGLPILEAFNNQCPILLSNSSCFPEIADDAAFYFQNEDSLSESTEKLILDKGYRNSKNELMRLRALDFSWQKTASQTEKLYRSII